MNVAPLVKSVRNKLVLVMLLATMSALLVTGIAFVGYERSGYQSARIVDVRSQAELIGRASIPALEFDDPGAARNNLGMLSIRPLVLGARLYTAAGVPFASYQKRPGVTLPGRPPAAGIDLSPMRLSVTQPVIGPEGRVVGYIYVSTEYLLRERIGAYLTILAGVFALSLIVAFFVALWLQRTLAAPLLAVTHVAERVISERDFSLRATKSTSDEVGVLVDAFNAMLQEIEEGSRALEQSERTFRQLANSIPLLCWMADSRGSLFWFNDRWFEYTGTHLDDVVGEGWHTVIGAPELAAVRAAWQDAVTAGTAFERVIPMRSKSGAFGDFLTRAVPLPDSSGVPTLWFGTCTDITAERQLAQQREELLQAERHAREAAEQAGRTKDDFLATLSHELRTPLNAILGWTHVMSRSNLELGPELKRGLETIQRNARAQARLIDDLLDMSRIMSGKVSLDFEMVDPAEVARAAVADLLPVAEAKGVLVSTTIEARGAQVMADPKRLQQIAWNLLSNAVKFTPERGRVRVIVRRREDGQVELRIEDEGIGIAPEFLPLIFERFQQADASTTRLYGGLGLGLSIVKHLVALHGGTVQAESAGLGRGATMTVALPTRAEPAAIVNRAPSREAIRVDLSGINALVVDDQEDARVVVQRILEECGARTRGAGSALEGLESVRAETFDILISDIGMPRVDGYEFLAWVRREPRGAVLPAIAVTAFARPEDKARALAAGYGAYVAKPFEAAQVLLAVGALLGRRLSPPALGERTA